MTKIIHGPKVVCRLNDSLAASEVTKVLVFKLSPHPTKPKAPPVRSQMLGNWDVNDDEESIGDACGAGLYQVCYKNEKEILGWSEAFNVEVSRRSPKGAVTSITANETPNGWNTIPGLTPATNAMLMISQQRALDAQTEAKRYSEALVDMYKSQMGTIVGIVQQLSEQAQRETAGVAVFRSQFEKVIVKLEERDKQLMELHQKALGLEVKLKNKEPEPGLMAQAIELAQSPLAEKAVEMVRGIAERVGNEVAEEGKRLVRARIREDPHAFDPPEEKPDVEASVDATPQA